MLHLIARIGTTVLVLWLLALAMIIYTVLNGS